MPALTVQYFTLPSKSIEFSWHYCQLVNWDIQVQILASKSPRTTLGQLIYFYFFFRTSIKGYTPVFEFFTEWLDGSILSDGINLIYYFWKPREIVKPNYLELLLIMFCKLIGALKLLYNIYYIFSSFPWTSI